MKSEAQIKAMLDELMKQNVDLSLLKASANRKLEALRNSPDYPHDARKMLDYDSMIDGYTAKLKILDAKINLLLEVLEDVRV